MIGLVALALMQAAVAAPPVTWSVRPESVTVAEAFTVTVTVRAPAAAPVTFPPGPDSAQTVEAVDPPSVTASADPGGSVRVATYRLMAWETGTQVVPLAPVVIGSGPTARRVDVQPQVFVRSVLPNDSALRVPRPALDVLAAGKAWWPWILAALAVIGLVVWVRLWRARRRAHAPPPSRLAIAEQALARVEALGLLEAGEPSRYVALHADVLRGYLSARADATSRAQTTAELTAALRARTRGIPLDRIAAVLTEADQVQFARKAVSAERAKEIAGEVRKLLAAADGPFRVVEQDRLRALLRATPPPPPKRAA